MGGTYEKVDRCAASSCHASCVPGLEVDVRAPTYEMGHDTHIITYPYGDDLPVEKAKVHRIAGSSAKGQIRVGPSVSKPLYDLRMVHLLYRIVRREKIECIHAHNYEGALIGIIVHWLTGVPIIYNAVNKGAKNDKLRKIMAAHPTLSTIPLNP